MTSINIIKKTMKKPELITTKKNLMDSIRAKMVEANFRETECNQVYTKIAAFVEENEGKKITRRILKDIAPFLPEYAHISQASTEYPETLGKLRYKIQYGSTVLCVNYGKDYQETWDFDLASEYGERVYSLAYLEKRNIWAQESSVQRVQERTLYLSNIVEETDSLQLALKHIEEARKLLWYNNKFSFYFPENWKKILDTVVQLTNYQTGQIDQLEDE